MLIRKITDNIASRNVIMPHVIIIVFTVFLPLGQRLLSFMGGGGELTLFEENNSASSFPMLEINSGLLYI